LKGTTLPTQSGSSKKDALICSPFIIEMKGAGVMNEWF